MEILEELEGIDDREEPVESLGSQLARTERCRDMKRMQLPKPLVILEQQLVFEGKERTSQGCKDRQLVIGPFDRRQRRTDRGHLLAAVEGAPAHEQVRNASGLEGLDVVTCDVRTKTLKTTKQNTHMTGRDRYTRRAMFSHSPSALIEKPLDEASDCARERALDGAGRDSPHPVWPRYRQRNKRRLCPGLVAKG